MSQQVTMRILSKSLAGNPEIQWTFQRFVGLLESTPSKTNSSHLKINGWKREFPSVFGPFFGDEFVHFQDIFRGVIGICLNSMQLGSLSSLKGQFFHDRSSTLITSEGLLLLMEEILHRSIWQISHYLQCFIHPRW